MEKVRQAGKHGGRKPEGGKESKMSIKGRVIQFLITDHTILQGAW